MTGTGRITTRPDPSGTRQGLARGTKRVFRGGNFLLKAKVARISNRDSGAPGERFRGTGIRCGGNLFAR